MKRQAVDRRIIEARTIETWLPMRSIGGTIATTEGVSTFAALLRLGGPWASLTLFGFVWDDWDRKKMQVSFCSSAVKKDSQCCLELFRMSGACPRAPLLLA